MAMTEEEIDLSIIMLDLPAGPFLYKTDIFGLNAMKFTTQTSLTPRAAVREVIAGLSALQTILAQTLIAAYKKIWIAGAGVNVSNGTVGDNSGTTISFQARELELKTKLKALIPFYNSFETMESRTSKTGSTMCTVMS